MTTKKPTITSTVLADLTSCAHVSKSNGVFTFRLPYFYRKGTVLDYVNKISTKLTDAKLAFNVEQSGDHWARFKGGAPVSKQSHYFVKVTIQGYLAEDN